MRHLLQTPTAAGLFAWVMVAKANAVDPDVQYWNVFTTDVRMVYHWGVQMQAEMRVEDNISQVGEVILKPSVRYIYADGLSFSSGYKFINRPQGFNDHDICQGVEHAHGLGEASVPAGAAVSQGCVGHPV